MSVFVTGTDTGVGKTYTAACLLRLARACGLRCAGFKPICCGDREDAELLLAASEEGLTLDDINPVWFRTPASPFTASLVEERDVDVQQICARFDELRSRVDFVVVEGVGGWLVPIRQDYFASDLAAAMRLPVLIVALNRLGCLNHTLLTVQSIAASGMQCLGVALNDAQALSDVAAATNRDVLSRICDVPILPGLATEMTVLPAEWRPIIECQANTKVSAL